MLFLQLLDRDAYGRLRETQSFGRMREASEMRGFEKDSHLFEGHEKLLGANAKDITNSTHSSPMRDAHASAFEPASRRLCRKSGQAFDLQ
ncbi:hypothetical protein ACQ86E_04730 [Bradyrhizobium betae]|uniref:hypothetical protein n=1 Tax=Bradyrhizobium betae TaxID=244734 RepID=UPI003D66C0AF